MTDASSESKRTRELSKLNAEFRRAVKQDRETLCEAHHPTRGASGPYMGGYLALRHLADLIYAGLADADPQTEWTELYVVQVIGKGDRALPSNSHQRQTFLEVIQRVLDECFAAARHDQNRFSKKPHEYVRRFLGSAPTHEPYRPFSFDPTSIGFFKILDWNQARRLDRDRVGPVTVVDPQPQNWFNDGAFESYKKQEFDASRGSPCPALVGYDEDTRESNSQTLNLRVAFNEYYRHVAVRRYIRDHHDVYDSVKARIYAADGEGGLREIIRRAPLSNICANVTVMDRGGDVLLLRRSPNTRIWNGFYQAGPHETMNWPSQGEDPEDCYQLAARALREEVGLRDPADYYGRIVFSWFGFYLPEASGYFFAHVVTKLTKSQITKKVREAESAFETDDVGWMELNDSNVSSVVDMWQNGPWSPGHDAQGRQFLPHATISLTQLSRVMKQGMLYVE